MRNIVVKRYDSRFKRDVEQLSNDTCVPLLKEDFENMFLIFDKDIFYGFVFMRMFNGFGEMNGPFLKNNLPENDMKKLLKKVVEILRTCYPDTVFYVLTEYPEYFEKLGCNVAFDVPPEILLKTKPG